MAIVSSSSSLAPKAANRATILLVDDDPFQANAHRAALERHFVSIERVSDASQAFIRVEEPEFRQTLALVVVGLRLPGMGGPAIVSELAARLPDMPIVAIGRRGETASDYTSPNVHFLPAAVQESELLRAVWRIFSARLRQVA